MHLQALQERGVQEFLQREGRGVFCHTHTHLILALTPAYASVRQRTGRFDTCTPYRLLQVTTRQSYGARGGKISRWPMSHATTRLLVLIGVAC